MTWETEKKNKIKNVFKWKRHNINENNDMELGYS